MSEEESDGPDGPDKPGPLPCPVCDAEFEAHNELRKHVEEEHE